MTATKLRWILVGLIVLLLGGFGFGTWWLQGVLSESVKVTDHVKIDAEVSTSELQQLKNLQKQLAEEQDLIERTKEIAATTEQYRYQDQVISDLADYAARRGIQISTFDFSGAARTKPTELVGGAKRTPFSVTLKGPVAYATFLRFLQDIEANLTKIQVTSLTLSPDKDPNKIANPSLGMDVYIKDKAK